MLIGATTLKIDHIIKVSIEFACFLVKKLFTWLVLGENPSYHFNPYYMTSRIT